MGSRSFVALLTTLLIALGAVTGAHAADWLDQRGAGPITGDVAAGQEKSLVCRACHGQQGNSPVPSFPNLGGQHAQYLYWEMIQYQRAIRPQSPMTEQMEPMSDQDLRDIAMFFAAQPLAANSTPRKAGEASARGEQLYRHGDPASGVPPCQGCHGAAGEGVPSRPMWPILRGQHADYVATRLRDYNQDKAPHTSNDFIMLGVARNLDDGMIDAIAAWLDSLPPYQP